MSFIVVGRYLLLVLLAVSSSSVTRAFQSPSYGFLPRNHGSVLRMAGKGFGKQAPPPPPPPSPKKEEEEQPPIQVQSTMSSGSQTSSSPPGARAPEPEMNEGQKELARMRRERAEQRDAELRNLRELRNTDAQVKEQPAAIPEKVANRMGARALPFVGIPIFGGMGAFVLFWYLATYKDLEFEPSLVAATTIGLLVVGLAGITYSVMSTSWDEDREGTFLGTEEFSRNVDNLKAGFGRSKQNAILRDKMDQMDEDEIERALRDLERRENSQDKKSEWMQ